MGKISEKKKNDITVYATKIGANLQAAGNCQTHNEVDAVYECTKIVRHYRLLYLKAKQNAPHNITYNIQTHEEFLKEAKNKTEEYEIFLAINQSYPLCSTVQATKKEINDLCRDILKKSGIGEKRIRKIIASLKSTLTDEEEEFKDLNTFLKEIEQLKLL